MVNEIFPIKDIGYWSEIKLDIIKKYAVELENFAAIASHDPQEPLHKITTLEIV